jgi:hypothetical protein
LIEQHLVVDRVEHVDVRFAVARKHLHDPLVPVVHEVLVHHLQLPVSLSGSCTRSTIRSNM